MNDRPNILLIMTDQHRGDCLGLDGHPVVQTPYLDNLGGDGLHFARAYSACPVCIPARRTLMTGRRPASHGVLMNYDTRLDGPTLPRELSRAGYQTHLVGKLHLWPKRARHGFDSTEWADSPCPGHGDGNYGLWLQGEGLRMPQPGGAHGMDINGYPARPFHLDERYHFTNWVTDRALDFLERRDPTAPFFLKVSYFHPHQPLTPPACFWDRYIHADLPTPPVGDWARVFDRPRRGLPVAAWRVWLDPARQRQMQAGYYGCIDHIDSQIGRLLHAVDRRRTIVVFTADHGDMLGDHQWIRKRNAFEGSARIPMLMAFPPSLGVPSRRRVDVPVELMDIMPTLLDAAGVPVPETVDGSSLLPLLRGATSAWREYVHGECSEVPSLDSGMQYLTDGKRKYIYYPGPGTEQFFDLENDPREMVNLAAEDGRRAEVAAWRERLIRELTGRPEGFTDGKRLIPLGRSTPPCLPGFERPA